MDTITRVRVELSRLTREEQLQVGLVRMSPDQKVALENSSIKVKDEWSVRHICDVRKQFNPPMTIAAILIESDTRVPPDEIRFETKEGKVLGIIKRLPWA